jgi:hypothetical protein
MVLNIENIFDHFTKLSFSSAANIPSWLETPIAQGCHYCLLQISHLWFRNQQKIAVCHLFNP